MTINVEANLQEDAATLLGALESALEGTVHDASFFQRFLKKMKIAPLENWSELLDELEEHLDMDVFS